MFLAVGLNMMMILKMWWCDGKRLKPAVSVLLPGWRNGVWQKRGHQDSGWLLAGGGIVQLYIHRHEALSFMDGLPFSEWLLNDMMQC